MDKELSHVLDILKLQKGYLPHAKTVAEQFARELAADTSIMYKQNTHKNWQRIPPIVALEELGPTPGFYSQEFPDHSLSRRLQEAQRELGMSKDDPEAVPNMLHKTNSMHYRTRERCLNTGNATEIMMGNFVYRILAKFTIDLCSEIDSLCKNAECKLHIGGEDRGMLRVTPNPSYFQQVRDIAHSVVSYRCENLVQDAVDSEIRVPSADLLARIMGEDKLKSLKITQTTLADLSLDALETLEKTNPGLVGAWVYGLLMTARELTTSGLTAANHESVVVKWVAETSGLKPGTMPWQYLAGMSAKEAFAFLLRGAKIRDASISASFKDVKYILELHADVVNAPKLKMAAVMRLKATRHTAGGPVARLGPLLRAYLHEVSKPAKERGVSQADLNTQFTDMLRWADSLYRRHLTQARFEGNHCTCWTGGEPVCVLVPREDWRSLRRRSDTWHQKQEESAK